MEAALRSLLHQIYATQAHQPPTTAGSQDTSRTLSTDDFRMFVYKVVPCSRRGPHSWVECAFCHPGEKASRRCPSKFNYAPLACPALKKDGQCLQGDGCVFAHNLFEYWLHPTRYRTQLCSYGIECKRSICFFAHHPGELRVTEHTAQLLALEKELEGNDPTYAASSVKWGINTAPQQGNRQRQHQEQSKQLNSRPPRMQQPHSLSGVESAQLAQIRQLQTLQAQAQGQSQHAMLNALSRFPGQSQNHLAMFEGNAPMPHQMPMTAGLSPCSSLLPQTQQEGHMAATMKMLSELSMAGNAMAPAPARLQSYSSMPAPVYQQPQQIHHQNSASDDTLQALQLISQLQQLAGRANNSAASNNSVDRSNLQSVLLNSLPQLLMQLGAGAAPAAAATNTPNSSAAPAEPIHLHPCMSAPQAFAVPGHAGVDDAGLYGSTLKCPPSKASSGSPSPANALSIATRRTGGSSCSSQISDGTRSPPLSHHSDEGIWAVRDEDKWAGRRSLGSMAPELPKDNLQDAGPFSNLASFKVLKEGDSRLTESDQALAGCLPVSLDDGDLGLASGMSDMSGASAMIASLSQLIDGHSTLQG